MVWGQGGEGKGEGSGSGLPSPLGRGLAREVRAGSFSLAVTIPSLPAAALAGLELGAPLPFPSPIRPTPTLSAQPPRRLLLPDRPSSPPPLPVLGNPEPGHLCKPAVLRPRQAGLTRWLSARQLSRLADPHYLSQRESQEPSSLPGRGLLCGRFSQTPHRKPLTLLRCPTPIPHLSLPPSSESRATGTLPFSL